MNTLPVEHFLHELVTAIKEYWVQVAIFCLFAAGVFLILRLFFNL